VCEILSASTRVEDLGPKRKLYARQGSPWLWLIDPNAHALETFELAGATWQLQGTWSESDVIQGLAPFPELTIRLADWWLA
jgi:Uma2 family endonuclease